MKMFKFYHYCNLSFRWRLISALLLSVGVQKVQEVSAGNVVLQSPDQRLERDSGIELKFFGNASTNSDNNKLLKRDKRFLLWTGGGISKLVLGFLMPVETRDRVNWRTLNMAYNWQAQYVPLPSAQFIWSKFTRDLINRRRQFDANGIFEKDASRLFVYRAIELFLNSRGKSGKHCLLKAICEAAEHPIEATGVFDQILHLILTPNTQGSDSEHDDYVNARLAGEHGSDCRRMYSKCPHGDGLLDSISFLM